MRLLDLTGKQFGNWRVVGIGERRRQPSGVLRVYWDCICECGTQRDVISGHLTSGLSVSCGCIQSHDGVGFSFGESPANSREKKAWTSMINRCTSSNNPRYYRYGGRGIKVCQRWMESFENFFSDMGERPSMAHSVDRIDNDGDYCPENCRWATRKEQQRNQERTMFVTANGLTLPMREWAERTGISIVTLQSRKYRGYTDDQIINQPVGEKRSP